MRSVCIDCEGRVRGTRQVAHTALAIHDALAWVRDTCGVPAAAIAVGIELRAGPLVERVSTPGFPSLRSIRSSKTGFGAGLRRPPPKTIPAMPA